VLKEATTAEREKMRKELKEKDERLAAIAEGGSDVAAAESAEEGESKGSTQTASAETYTKRAQELMDAGKTASQAYKQAAKELPEAFAAYRRVGSSKN